MRGGRLAGKSGLEKHGKESNGRCCIVGCSVTRFLRVLSGKPRVLLLLPLTYVSASQSACRMGYTRCEVSCQWM
jgi:hypothetical protein